MIFQIFSYTCFLLLVDRKNYGFYHFCIATIQSVILCSLHPGYTVHPCHKDL